MNTKISILILTSFVLFSCEKEIELDVNSSESQHVIEALLPFDSYASVSIVKSKNYNQDHQYPPVPSATVTLSDNTGNSEVLEFMPSGLYESRIIKGIQGVTYFLTIEIGEKIYTSLSTMPYAVQIEDLSMFHLQLMGSFPIIRFNDPPGIENYYRAILYINGKRMPDMAVMDDEDTDGKMNSSFIPFDSQYNNGNDIAKGDIVFVEMQCLDKGAYTYFETLRRINMSLTNPTSNITGGALGYFSTYISSSKEIIADW